MLLADPASTVAAEAAFLHELSMDRLTKNDDDTGPLLLNCPQCPRRLRFVRIVDGLPYYVCAEHGWFVIAKDSHLRASSLPPESVH